MSDISTDSKLAPSDGPRAAAPFAPGVPAPDVAPVSPSNSLHAEVSSARSRSALIGLIGRRPIDALFGLLVLVFAGFRLGRTVASPIAIWNDSLGYMRSGTEPWFSAGLWVGARPPMTGVLWKLTGTPAFFTVAQTTISAVAWSFLAFTVMRLVRPGWRSLAGAALVLGFATAWPVTLWDSLVMSESISLSALAVILACVLWLSRRWSRAAVIGLIVASVVYVGARDESIWTVGLLGIAIAAYGATRRLRARRRRTGRVLLAGLALLAIASVGEVAAISSHRSVQNVEHDFAVRVLPYPDKIAWFAARGMPMQAALDELATTTPHEPGRAPVVWPDITEGKWAPLVRYFETKAVPDYTWFLLTHPGYDLSAPFQRPQLAYNFGAGDLSVYGAGEGHLPYVSVPLFPAWGIALGMGIAGAVLLVLRRQWWRREAAAVVLLAGIGLVTMLVAWHGDGEEIVRHMLEGNVQARLAALLLLVMGACGIADPGDRRVCPKLSAWIWS